VHMAYVKHPLVGDQTYGGRLQIPKGASEELKEMLRGFSRQALHARKLGLIHPVTGKHMEWKAPLPDDMKQLIAVLEADIAQDDDEEDFYMSDFADEFTGEFTNED